MHGGPASEDMGHQSIAEISICNPKSLLPLHPFFKATIPLKESSVDQLQIALGEKLVTHVRHELSSLLVEGEPGEATKFQLVLAMLHGKKGLVDES